MTACDSSKDFVVHARPYRRAWTGEDSELRRVERAGGLDDRGAVAVFASLHGRRHHWRISDLRASAACTD